MYLCKILWSSSTSFSTRAAHIVSHCRNRIFAFGMQQNIPYSRGMLHLRYLLNREKQFVSRYTYLIHSRNCNGFRKQELFFSKKPSHPASSSVSGFDIFTWFYNPKFFKLTKVNYLFAYLKGTKIYHKIL